MSLPPFPDALADRAGRASPSGASFGASLGAEWLDWLRDTGLSPTHRPIRMRLQRRGFPFGGALVAHSVRIDEAVCAAGSLRIDVLAVSTRADLAPNQLLGLPIAVEFVTDRGGLRSTNAVVTQAVPGQSDGGLQVWSIQAEDALSIRRRGRASRVFLRQSVVDIAHRLFDEWRQADPVLAEAFETDTRGLRLDDHPVREMTLQWNESDGDFLIRLFRKHGIGWAVRAGGADAPTDASLPGPHLPTDDTPAPRHTLVLFDDAGDLPPNPAGRVHYRQDGPSQERDGITLWSPVVGLVPSRVERRSFDYKTQRADEAGVPGTADLGRHGAELAHGLVDAAIDPPHWADGPDDAQRLATVRMQRHEMEARHVRGAGGVRDATVGTWLEVLDLPGLPPTAGPDDRAFLFVQVTHHATNNLPKRLDERLSGLFAASGWRHERPVIGADDAARRYANTFQAVPRRTPVVPSFDPATDWPRLHPVHAIVACPPGEEVHCDAGGRVRLRFPGLRATAPATDPVAGTAGVDADSAWVRVAHGTAGAAQGHLHLPRAGDEVIVGFLMGDPDKPYVAGSVYSPERRPPAFHPLGGLPGNRHESGTFVREIGGHGYVQARFDATPGQVSYSVAASSPMTSLSLGRLHTPRIDGAARPRGEGAELTTLGALSMRGQAGARLTTEPSHPTDGPQLGRDPLLGLTRALGAVARQLGQLAEAHHLEAPDLTRLDDWIRSLERWEGGTITEPDKAGGGRPILAVDSVAGTGIVSHDNLLLGAQTNVDTIAAGRIQSSAGRDIRQTAGGNVELFADGSVRVRAGKGAVVVSADGGHVTITGAKSITLAAAEELNLSGKVVNVLAEGARTTWGAGAITEEARGRYAIHSASFQHLGAGDGKPLPVDLPAASIETDERFVIRYRSSGRPKAGQRYRIELEDGRRIEGVTDAEGRTEVASADAIRIAELTLLDR